MHARSLDISTDIITSYNEVRKVAGNKVSKVQKKNTDEKLTFSKQLI